MCGQVGTIPRQGSPGPIASGYHERVPVQTCRRISLRFIARSRGEARTRARRRSALETASGSATTPARNPREPPQPH
eukprot:2972488-Prymnesium_polylepis.2